MQTCNSSPFNNEFVHSFLTIIVKVNNYALFQTQSYITKLYYMYMYRYLSSTTCTCTGTQSYITKLYYMYMYRYFAFNQICF